MKCKYCGKPAGFFSLKHDACQVAFVAKMKAIKTARGAVIDAFVTCVKLNGDVSNLVREVTKKVAGCGNDSDGVLVEGWQNALSVAMKDEVLSAAEETTLTEMLTQFDHFGLTQHTVGEAAFSKLNQGRMLRAVLNGEMPTVDLSGAHIPFNLQKSEKLLWLVPDTEYYKEITRTHRAGGSQGVSVRIMRGVYYRVGGFKSRPVHTTSTEHLDSGLLGVTTKHLYFFGGSKRFRVAYSKVVAFEHFSDGIGLQRDLVSAKPETFITGDGWFICNLISNLASIDLR